MLAYWLSLLGSNRLRPGAIVHGLLLWADHTPYFTQPPVPDVILANQTLVRDLHRCLGLTFQTCHAHSLQAVSRAHGTTYISSHRQVSGYNSLLGQSSGTSSATRNVLSGPWCPDGAATGV